MDRKSKLRELLAATEISTKEAPAPAMEAMEYLRQTLLAIPPFKLKDGTQAWLKPYMSPELNKDGQASCGVDVLLENVGHLEFTVTNTDWGKSFSKKRGDSSSAEQRSR